MSGHPLGLAERPQPFRPEARVERLENSGRSALDTGSMARDSDANAKSQRAGSDDHVAPPTIVQLKIAALLDAQARSGALPDRASDTARDARALPDHAAPQAYAAPGAAMRGFSSEPPEIGAPGGSDADPPSPPVGLIEDGPEVLPPVSEPMEDALARDT
ncbi:hypothetical protein ACFQ4E_05480 [Litorisediminicola beolgyonensis]|uniref:Uncharacterized protein n=1 Tax=Litorisediminicola beolgyonensis TaxID=1173614 RepID=A0ABW3ZFM5_9RHOB